MEQGWGGCHSGVRSTITLCGTDRCAGNGCMEAYCRLSNGRGPDLAATIAWSATRRLAGATWNSRCNGQVCPGSMRRSSSVGRPNFESNRHRNRDEASSENSVVQPWKAEIAALSVQVRVSKKCPRLAPTRAKLWLLMLSENRAKYRERNKTRTLLTSAACR